MERLIEDISFDAPDRVAAAAQGGSGSGGDGGGSAPPVYKHVVDAAVVREKVGVLLKKQDLSKFIL